MAANIDDAASDDSMPPLEYVGAVGDGTHHVPLRPGDNVVLTGLNRAELNGQRGEVLPFMNAQQTRQGRLSVKLASGAQLSIKRLNLSKVEDCLVGRDADDAASDNSMPPLENVGIAGRGNEAADAIVSDDDTDSMPPLEYVGTAPTAEEAAMVTGSLTQSNGTCDPDREPTHDAPVASAAVQTQRADAKPPGYDDFVVGDVVVLKGLSRHDLNGQLARVLPGASAECERLPVELFPAGERRRLSIKRQNMERASITTERPAASTPALEPSQAYDQGAESDDSMPPLEWVGAGPGTQEKKMANEEIESDDSMPLLELESMAHPPPARSQEKDDGGAESDGSMPPLDYGGVVANTEVHENAVGVAREVPHCASTPKPQHGETPAYPPCAASPAIARDDAAADSVSPCFEAGDRVMLVGLSKMELNGSDARVLPFTTAATKLSDRLPVQLCKTGQRLAIKLENLILAGEDTASDISAPPLEYIGTVPPRGENQGTRLVDASADVMRQEGNAAAAVGGDDASDDSMPPLEYFGVPPARDDTAAATEPKRKEDRVGLDKRSLPSLEHVGFVGPTGKDAEATDALENATSSRARSAIEEATDDPAPSPEQDGKAEFRSSGLHTGTWQTGQGHESKASSTMQSSSLRSMELRPWCDALKLPNDFLEQLEAEDVRSPCDLAFLPEADLLELSKGLRFGAKGRFLAGVHNMR